METPIFSIIVPCYNQADFLEETLNSVHKQTFEHWECLIIDDGSPDNSAEIAKIWQNKDSRFILLQKENGGISNARNYGLAHTKGKYIQFLDSDDILLPSKLADCHQQHLAGNDIVVTAFEHLEGKQIILPFCVLKQEYLDFNNILLKWDLDFSIPIHCGSFRKETIGDILFPENLKSGEDWIFWLNIFKQEPTAYFIDKALALYRLHHSSATKNAPLMTAHKIHAQNVIFNTLDPTHQALFFERFSAEAVTRREELFAIYRKQQKRLKYRIKAFFKQKK